MDDDDESRDQGRKTNTDRDFKPRHEKRKEHAPRGAMGRAPAGPGGQRVRMTETESQGPKGPGKPIEKDGRPVFFEQKDQDVNREYQKTHRMIGLDSPQHPDYKAPQNEKKQHDRPKVSQSAFAKSFRQAHDGAPQTKPKGPEID